MRSTLAALPQMSSTFFKIGVCVCVYEDVYRCLQRPGEGVRSPRAGVTHRQMTLPYYVICTLGNVLESFERASGLSRASSLLTLFFETWSVTG